MTKEMEGDGSTGALVLPKYNVLKDNLTGKKNQPKQPNPLYPMFYKMLGKVNTYLEQALLCEKLVMDTLLHPAFRLAAFKEFFPAKQKDAKATLFWLFLDRKRKFDSKKMLPQSPPTNLQKKRTKVPNKNSESLPFFQCKGRER